jgi:phospholipid/cholesterol/gamma-HCH transport system substrate-binding protein
MDYFKAIFTMVLGLSMLGILVIFIGGYRIWHQTDTYWVRFGSIQDLQVNRPVKYSGLSVGKVEELGVDPDNPALMLVKLSLDENFPLYRGTTATIGRKGLVGDNYVLLSLDREAGPRLEPGAEIPTRKSAGMQEVMQRMYDLMDRVEPRLVAVLENAEAMVSADNARNVNQALAAVPSLLRDTREAVNRASSELARFTDATSSSLDNAAGDLRTTLGKIDTMTETVNQRLLPRLVDMQSDLDQDKEQVMDVVRDIDRLTRDLQQLTRSLKERPWQLVTPPENREIP